MRRAAAWFCVGVVALHLHSSASAIEWGADLSSWAALERAGTACCDRGAVHADAPGIWRGAGGRWVRLRIHTEGVSSPTDRAAMVGLAARATDLGLRVLVDFHWSDTWADPGRQDLPSSWRDAAARDLPDSVHAVTARALAEFRRAGAQVDAVQLGNEIDHGLLWPHGRIVAADHDDPHWSFVVDVLRAGVRAVREEGDALVVIHTSAQDEGRTAASIAARLRATELDFDVAALSYHPWWHGDLDALDRALARTRAAADRPVWIVESAYPFTLDWSDDVHNPVGLAEHLLPGYPATGDGQRAFFAALAARYAADQPDGVLFVFEPAWVSAPTLGSPWENLAWFDFAGAALPVWELLADQAPHEGSDPR